MNVITALAALAQSVRLKVFRALVWPDLRTCGPDGGNNRLRVGVPATSLSFHLKELIHSGLVSQERDGRYLIYRAKFDEMNGLLGFPTASFSLITLNG